MISIIKPNIVYDNYITEVTWGGEVIIHNENDYYFKILLFKEGMKNDMVFHNIKNKTWYIEKGKFKLKYIDTKNAIEHEVELESGTIIEIDRGDPHQLIALTDGFIYEVSTQHFDDDSYRIRKGDSQIKEIK